MNPVRTSAYTYAPMFTFARPQVSCISRILFVISLNCLYGIDASVSLTSIIESDFFKRCRGCLAGRCWSLFSVYNNKSFGSHTRALHNNSTCSRLITFDLLCRITCAEYELIPDFTRNLWGLSIPLALKMGVKLRDNISVV